MENYKIGFGEARGMGIYKFITVDNVVDMIRTGNVKNFFEDRVAAVLEFGNIDIELNFYPPDDKVNTENVIENDKINDYLEFFCCAKFDINGESDWDSYDSINVFVNIDFTKDDWKEKLEKEMFRVLMIYADEKELKWSELNKSTFKSC